MADNLFRFCGTCGGSDDLYLMIGGGNAKSQCATCANKSLPSDGSIRFATRMEAFINTISYALIDPPKGITDSPLEIAGYRVTIERM